MQTCADNLSDLMLAQISERVEHRTGLHFPALRFDDLRRGLAQAGREVGCNDPATFIAALLQRDLNNADLEALAGTLTIGETHFFRDPRAFEFLESVLLLDLIAAKRGGDRSLRIWSAGCASGEEPYSMAILLHRVLPDLSDWHVSILGTDINPKMLAKAEAGVYTNWSFRDTPDWVKPRYFVARPNDRHEIQPWVKRMVQFACLNLAEGDYPSLLNHTNGLDLIICRNVLLYFAASRIPEVIERFHRALVVGGHLVIGSVEACQMEFPGFVSVAASGVAVYRKEMAAEWPPPARLAVSQESVPEWHPPEEPLPENIKPAWRTERECPPAVALELAAEPADILAAAGDRFAVGRFSEARGVLLSASDGWCGTDPQAAMMLVQCHANLGELAEALIWCERALTVTKTDPILHYLHASILQELERDEDALRVLRNVLFLDPGHVLAHFTMANLHRRSGDATAAARHLANVRQLLFQLHPDEELPQSGGLTVDCMNALLAAMTVPSATTKGLAHE